MIPVKTKSEQDRMRKAGRLTGDALKMIEAYIKPGVTTLELDRRIEEFFAANGASPSFKNLYGFPNAACISVNEVVVHGIPSEYALKEGDIVSIDVGALIGGFHGDAARTFAVGQIDAALQRLIDVARESFFKGIGEAREGRRLGDISNAIQTHAESNGYGVVRALTGHGIGRKVHEDPSIPNFGPPSSGPVLKAGYCLAIEPMINLGTFRVSFDQADGWTCRTADGKPSAHYENTVLITTGEPEILTL
ncbi:MAG: type I methionyl aminopeptidase [Clostridiales bacterium]|jgi:methionyl aminopeptidase|nr:type I methionyl aminopeptidase [Clostridiales bacterium]